MTFEPLENLNGRVVIITGAMGGIGYATAQRLAKQGARIIGIVRRNLDEAQQKLNELPNSHLEHMAVLADVTNKEQLREAYAKISPIGRCDVLVNTVGKTMRIPWQDVHLLKDEFFDKVTQDNLRSYFSTIRTFHPLLKKTDESIIVNIGSMAGQRGGGSNLAYAAAKAGVDSLTRSLSQSLAPIRVMGVSPGAIDTGFVPNPAEGYYDRVAESTPLKRGPSVVDVASAVEASVMLLRFTTGQVINIDGGRWV
jgi:3-oxoacyl-[acyl-carrier protein] reductase